MIFTESCQIKKKVYQEYCATGNMYTTSGSNMPFIPVNSYLARCSWENKIVAGTCEKSLCTFPLNNRNNHILRFIAFHLKIFNIE